MAEQAKNGDTVRVHYTGRLDDGQIFDSSRDEEGNGEPLEFQIGSDQVIPGFDAGVRGMQIGDTRRIEIEPDDAYGPRHDSLTQSVPRDGMNLDAEPQKGMNLVMQLPDGNQIPVAITDVTDTHVTLDANHPLAGQRLAFDIELISNKSDEY